LLIFVEYNFNNEEVNNMDVHQQSEADTIRPDHIDEIVMGFQKSRILLTAYELGLFTALGTESKSSAETADLLGTDPRATDRLMNALCALRLLDKMENKFSNSLLAGKFLVKGSPFYMTGLQHRVHLWNSWSTLTQAVRKGESVIYKEINDRGENWLRSFIAAMHDRAEKTAPEVVSKIDLSGVSRVLDVGGGSGAYAMAFAKAKKGVSADVFDLGNVVPITRMYIEKAGLSDRVKTVVGDYHADAPGNGYDLVFLSAIVHINSPSENIELIKKCAGALNPGGQVVVQDFVMDEDRTTPGFGTFFALNMLVSSRDGDTYTESELSDWMKEAGLSNIKRIDMSFGTTLIIGRKQE
jgi:2-polyprenyl-3-methyl-5-hydroxy-6-metoxy-1,4-benzoquinol methylase